MSIVADFMAEGVQTLAESDTLTAAAMKMEKYGCYHLPVVNGQSHVLGLVSHRDVLKAMPSPLFPVSGQGVQPDAIVVSEFMQTDLITVTPGTDLRQAAMFLRNQKIGCLPVVENKKLLGIITDTDFLNIAVDLLTEVESLEPIAV